MAPFDILRNLFKKPKDSRVEVHNAEPSITALPQQQTPGPSPPKSWRRSLRDLWPASGDGDVIPVNEIVIQLHPRSRPNNYDWYHQIIDDYLPPQPTRLSPTVPPTTPTRASAHESKPPQTPHAPIKARTDPSADPLLLKAATKKVKRSSKDLAARLSLTSKTATKVSANSTPHETEMEMDMSRKAPWRGSVVEPGSSIVTAYDKGMWRQKGRQVEFVKGSSSR